MGLWTKMGLIEVERDRSKLRPKLRVIKGRGWGIWTSEGPRPKS